MQRDPGEADEGEIQDFSAADDNMEGKKVDLLFLIFLANCLFLSMVITKRKA